MWQLEQWIKPALAMAHQHPQFEARYTHFVAFDFFIANPQEQQFFVANLIASSDQVGRKFPMLFGYLVEVEAAATNLASKFVASLMH